MLKNTSQEISQSAQEKDICKVMKLTIRRLASEEMLTDDKFIV